MKTCLRCERHMLRAETDCPFCGTQQSCAPARPAACAWVLLGALGAAACGAVADDGVAAEGTSSTQTSSGDTTAATMVATTVDTTAGSSESSTIGTSVATTDPSTSSSSDDQGDSPGAFYAVSPDGGPSALECDIWAQDCPKGEKCAPTETAGSAMFDGSHCTPVDPDAAAIGEPCTVVGGPFSGIDDCGLGAMCLDADPDTGAGICVALCEGSAANPLCSDPLTECAVFDPGAFAVCLASCDILADECPEGEVCMTVGDADVCVSA